MRTARGTQEDEDVSADQVAFAEARLDEDEREIRNDPPMGLGYARLGVRLLRDIKGARNILARYQDCLARTEDPAYPQVVARDQVREYEDYVLPNLLMRWADHPDYDQEWKP